MSILHAARIGAQAAPVEALAFQAEDDEAPPAPEKGLGHEPAVTLVALRRKEGRIDDQHLFLVSRAP